MKRALRLIAYVLTAPFWLLALMLLVGIASFLALFDATKDGE